MKKLLSIIVLMILASGFAFAYDSGQIEIEDGISSDCSGFSPCIHWEDNSMTGSEGCTYSTGLCYVGSGSWFVINDSPASVPSGASCNVTVNVSGSGSSDENLTLEINSQSQTLPDHSSWTVATFPNDYSFTGGYSGSDLLNFSGPNNQVQVDWYQIQCTDQQVPEFSFTTLAVGLIAVAGGLFVIRRKLK